MIPNDPDERRALIGEYVLGLLDGEERAEVQALIERDRDAARVALDWEARLLDLSDALPPESPSPSLWPRIQTSLGMHQTSWLQSVWNNLNAWRLTSAALAFALILAVLPWTSMWQPTGDAYTVVLQAPGEAAMPGWVVHVSADGELRLQPLASDSIPEGRSVQFWTLVDPADGPRSLGLIEPGEETRLAASRIGPVIPGQLFELTLEPAGGSPLSRPTGPVLYIGRAVLANR